MTKLINSLGFWEIFFLAIGLIGTAFVAYQKQADRVTVLEVELKNTQEEIKDLKASQREQFDLRSYRLNRYPHRNEPFKQEQPE